MSPCPSASSSPGSWVRSSSRFRASSASAAWTCGARRPFATSTTSRALPRPQRWGRGAARTSDMKITNISPGPRGVNTKSGVVHLAPGETRDLELEAGEAKTLSEEWFHNGAISKADAAKAAEAAAADQAEADKIKQAE